MKALFIGSATADLNAFCNTLYPVGVTHHRHTEKFLQLSFASKTMLDDVQLTSGGSAANSAVACNKLGTPVELISAVGGDLFGRLVEFDLKRHGVSTRHVHTLAEEKTSIGINLLCPDGEKTNLVYKGATDALSQVHLEENQVKNADAVICTSLASKKNIALFEKAFHLAKKHRKLSVFAPSITMLRARKKEVRKAGPFDACVLNFEEAGFLLETHDPVSKIDQLPGKINIVTHDAKGTYVFFDGQTIQVPTLPVKVRDTTGAGDAFTGALVHGLLQDMPTADAVKLGTAVACWKIQDTGAKLHGSKKQILDFFHRNFAHLKEKPV